MKRSTLGFVALVVCSLEVSVLFQNCSNTQGTAGVAGASGISMAVAVTSATTAQCSSGGSVYTVFQDLNGSGVLAANDNVISTQVVCNGNNGLNSLISTNRISVGLTGCAAGSGVQINTGPDSNNDGTLEASEITSTQVICDGVNGAVGAAGPAGSNGYNAVFSVVPASVSSCPSGGSVILMALDVNRTGQYSGTYPDQQSVTICNGQPAPVSAYVPIQPIMPCGNTVAYKEVLLLLGDGQVLAAFSDNASGLETRLSFLPDGSYIDTDDSGCVFSLSTQTSQNTRSISWLGKVQLTWTYPVATP